MTPYEWILSNDTGISSKTIWAVMMGAAYPGHSFPRDPDDFGRCHRLLKQFPEWRSRLHEVAEVYPYWAPLIDIWPQMEQVWKRVEASKDNEAARELYSLMLSKRPAIMEWIE